MPNKFIIAESKTSAVSGRFFTAGPFDFASLHSGVLGGLTLLNIAGDTKRPHKSLCGALESAYGNKTHIYHLTAGN